MSTYIEELKEVYSQKKLIPFIGSGFSKPLDLPDWGGLVGGIAEKVGYEPSLFTLHGNYQQLLEYVKEFHPSVWQDFIYKMTISFGSNEIVEKRKASQTHQILSALEFKTIYTTNYDTHIEDALIDAGKKVKELSSLETFLSSDSADVDCEVIKFHGTLKDEQTMVLTESEYFKRMALDEPVDVRLRTDLLSNSFIFIGYSFNDPNIRYIWYKIYDLKNRQKRGEKLELPPSYFVTFGHSPIQNSLLNKWRIYTINLDPSNKNNDLYKLLSSLS